MHNFSVAVAVNTIIGTSGKSYSISFTFSSRKGYQSEVAQRSILLSKLVTPFTDTMSLVNDKSTQLSVFVDFGEEFAERGFGS